MNRRPAPTLPAGIDATNCGSSGVPSSASSARASWAPYAAASGVGAVGGVELRGTVAPALPSMEIHGT